MGYGRRRRRSSYMGFEPYVSVAEKKAKAEKKLAQLKKKNPHIKPVVIEGYAIAGSWWGKSWNSNLEGYADYSNRITRGRSYVRNGAILDLQINPGEVRSLVQGTRSKPYSVTIKIKEIPKSTWEKLSKASEGKLDSLQELLAGKFPKPLGELFTARGEGLFPSPKEIEFSCTCPDWASMCKHVAAALYGIGARLDKEPALFFTLRKVDVKDLVSRAVKSKSRELLKKAEKKSSRVMDDNDIAGIFGIELEEDMDFEPSPVTASKKPGKKMQTRGKKQKSRAKPGKAGNAGDPVEAKSPVDVIAGIIRRSRKGVGIAKLKQRTGLEDQEIYTIVYKLKREGKVKNLSRGIYIGT